MLSFRHSAFNFLVLAAINLFRFKLQTLYLGWYPKSQFHSSSLQWASPSVLCNSSGVNQRFEQFTHRIWSFHFWALSKNRLTSLWLWLPWIFWFYKSVRLGVSFRVFAILCVTEWNMPSEKKKMRALTPSFFFLLNVNPESASRIYFASAFK